MASSNASLATPTTGGTKTGFLGGVVLLLVEAPAAVTADGGLAAVGPLLLLLLLLLLLVLLVLELVLRLRLLGLVRRLFPPAAVGLPPSSEWSLPPPLLPSSS